MALCFWAHVLLQYSCTLLPSTRLGKGQPGIMHGHMQPSAVVPLAGTPWAGCHHLAAGERQRLQKPHPLHLHLHLRTVASVAGDYALHMHATVKLH